MADPAAQPGAEDLAANPEQNIDGSDRADLAEDSDLKPRAGGNEEKNKDRRCDGVRDIHDLAGFRTQVGNRSPEAHAEHQAAESQKVRKTDRGEKEADDQSQAVSALVEKAHRNQHGKAKDETDQKGRQNLADRLKNGQIAESALTVSDTTPPTGESAFLWIKPGDPLTPDMLVDRPHDETALTFAFVEEPDASLMHAQSVTVRMTDEGGNTTDVVSTLAISHVEPITVEVSREPLNADAFGAAADVVLTEPFVPDTPGIYSLPATVNGEPDYALVTAVDTTPPTVEKRTDAALYTLHPTSPEAAFSADDLSPVDMEWIVEPDWEQTGEQTVRVRAVDRYENETVLDETVTLTADTEPPVLYGVVNRIAYIGESIAYFAEVYAEDAVDGRTEVTVESEVVPDREGTYRVVYSTVDLSGNRASAECTFRLVKSTVTEEEVKALAQDVLRGLVTDDMVAAEKLRAVFNYVRGHVHYVGNSDKSDWRKEAARGFKTGKGDCFTFYSVTRALLDELEIDYMSVTRKGGRTRHYWVIVNIGTGWYHFDPTIAPHHKHKCFMWTNKQCQIKPYFWRYEQSSFPEIATDPFDYDAVVKAERSGMLP